MKKWLIIGAIIAGLIGFISWQGYQLKKIKSERDTYKNNTSVLIQDVQRYMALDSLNVVSVGNLELKIAEFEKYRDEDYKIIDGLKVDNNRLQSVITSQTKTIYELNGNVRDSVIYVEIEKDKYITDTLRCIKINEKWFDLDGCSNNKNEFSGTFKNRDSLIYVEHIVPKKFLFIKWGIKEKKQELVSKNPHTEITGAEFITIRK